MKKDQFSTVINCMDGRVQRPLHIFVEDRYQTEFVDMITEPGPNKILAENKDHQKIESIKHRVDISVNKHGSRVIIIVGHYDCAGNPVDQPFQLEHIKASMATIKSWGFPAIITGVWVDKNWKVQIIEEDKDLV